MPNSFPRLALKPNKERSLERNHLWVFSGALQKLPEGLTDGDGVEVYSADGRYMATGHYQKGSIMVRILSFEPTDLDDDFWRTKLERAMAVRQRVGFGNNPETTVYRLVHGEGDGLPGLIIDVYGKVAVLQAHSVGMFRERERIGKLLGELMGDQLEAVYDKSGSTLNLREYPDYESGFLWGQSDPVWVKEYGQKFLIDFADGQKTGFFVDQRENRKLLGQYSKDREVLNVFAYTGGFSIAALAGGAKRVDSVDISQKAVDLIDTNVHENFGAEAPHRSFADDAFKFLQKIDQQYEVIVLDPPAFAKHRDALRNALQGYRKINRQAFEQIRPGGILFTFSCSQVVSVQDFRTAVFTAAAQSGRMVRILHQLTQPADHPVNLYHPEGEYLKGLVLAVE